MPWSRFNFVAHFLMARNNTMEERRPYKEDGEDAADAAAAKPLLNISTTN